jgi:hypothetical protein
MKITLKRLTRCLVPAFALMCSGAPGSVHAQVPNASATSLRSVTTDAQLAKGAYLAKVRGRSAARDTLRHALFNQHHSGHIDRYWRL